MERITLGGTPVDVASLDEFRSEVTAALDGDAPSLAVASANVEHLHHFGRDGAHRGFFESSPNRWLVLIDGTPIARAATRIIGQPAAKLSGSDLISDVFDLCAGRRIAIVGGTADTHRLVIDRLADTHPTVIVAHTAAPTRDQLTEPGYLDQLCADLDAADVDAVIVALPKPFGEHVTEHLAARSAVNVVVSFGAATDFVAGTQRRAPVWVSNAGAEWLWRLAHSPRRLARRYLIEGPPAWWNLRRHSSRQPTPTPVTENDERARLTRTLLAIDTAALCAAVLVAFALRTFASGRFLTGLAPVWPAAVGAVPLFVACLAAVGAYRPFGMDVTSDVFRRHLQGLAVGLGVLGFASYAASAELSRSYVILVVSCSVLFGGGGRWLLRRRLRRLRDQGRRRVRCVVVGDGPDADATAARLERHRRAGFWPVATIDCRPDSVTAPAALVLASTRRLAAGVAVVVPAGTDSGVVAELENRLDGSGVQLAVAPSLFDLDPSRVRVSSVADSPMFMVTHARLDGPAAFAKRTIDIVVAATVLTFTLPLLAAAAVWIKATDGGPVLFRQERIGRRGERFGCWKLRTMTVDAEARLDEVGATGVLYFKRGDDPRITRPGRTLRAWSIDELPQLVNVLRGDMSLVGPRPPLPREADAYSTDHLRRLLVRPGLTGLWQVSGRSDLSFDEAMSLDLYYVANWSFTRDLGILRRTVRVVLSRTGAY